MDAFRFSFLPVRPNCIHHGLPSAFYAVNIYCTLGEPCFFVFLRPYNDCVPGNKKARRLEFPHTQKRKVEVFVEFVTQSYLAYREAWAGLLSRAAPTWSAVLCSEPAVRSSLPLCRMLYSCSMAVSCWSSAKDRAKGTPKKRAEVVITQAPLPLKERTLQAALPTELALPEIQERVVGGTISRRAYNRSARVSSEGS